MAESPERDIEKQLRASAEQRRAEAGGPFELHEATRRSLQGEVARRYGKRAGDGTRSTRVWWAALWPRLAFGASLAVLLGVGVWVYLSPPGTRELAKQDQFKTRNSAKESADANRENAGGGSKLTGADRSSSALSPANGPLNPVAPALAISPDKTKDETDALKGAVSNLLASASTLPPGTADVRRASTATSTASGLSPATSNVPLLAAAAEEDQVRRDRAEQSSASEKKQSQMVSGRTYSNQIVVAFARGGGRGGRGGAGAGGGGGRGGAGGGRGGGGGTGAGGARGARGGFAPLQSFRVEQDGNSLRVVDADESVYEGTTEPVSTAPQATPAPATAQGAQTQAATDADVAQASLPTPQLNFTVAGTNRTFAQRIVFTGQVQQVTPPPGLRLQSAVTNPAVASSEAAFSNATLQSGAVAPAEATSRIFGRAVVGDNNTPFDVDAIATRP